MTCVKDIPSGGRIMAGIACIVMVTSLLASLVMSGCGEQAPEAGQKENGTLVEQEGEAEQIDAFLADDLLTGTGTRLQFRANDPGTTVPVSFSLSGPWNFTGGQAPSTLTIAMVAKETAPSQDSFPDATIAARSSWDPPPGMVEYNFQHKDESAWTAYGRFGSDGLLVTYSAPVRVLVFPATVGDSWTESYAETKDETVTEITAENLIVARNRLTVPAGTFQAFLLQTRVTATTGGQATATWDYIWLVPGIGRAAEIISTPGEEDEEFGTAAAFYRLQSFRIP